jgi:hypothetical protein
MKQHQFAVLRFAHVNLNRPEAKPLGLSQRSFAVFRNAQIHSPVRK